MRLGSPSARSTLSPVAARRWPPRSSSSSSCRSAAHAARLQGTAASSSYAEDGTPAARRGLAARAARALARGADPGLRDPVDSQDADRAAPGLHDPRVGSGLGARRAGPFHEAYMTHTSTSPNYQILSSLDIGRRQVELEGFELVQRQLDLATSLSQAIARHPLLRRTFRVLTAHDLIPEQYRETGRRHAAARRSLEHVGGVGDRRVRRRPRRASPSRSHARALTATRSSTNTSWIATASR